VQRGARTQSVARLTIMPTAHFFRLTGDNIQISCLYERYAIVFWLNQLGGEDDSRSNAEKSPKGRCGISSAHGRQRCRGFIHYPFGDRRVLDRQHARRGRLTSTASSGPGWQAPRQTPGRSMRGLMKKPTKRECEAAIRQMFEEWRFEPTQNGIAEVKLSYSKFRAWVDQKGYSKYFKFTSLAGSSEEDAERWFSLRFKQTWKY
jgi:hypothetical protein